MGFSPYELLYARPPVMPPAAAAQCEKELLYDDPAAAAADLVQRRQILQQRVPAALGNLAIAQQRDQLRYAVVRSGSYQPRIFSFQPGDYVYVKQQQQQQHNTLQPKARGEILRVVQVKPSGVIRVEGKCGQQAEVRQ